MEIKKSWISGQGDILVGDVPSQSESSVELAGSTLFSRSYVYSSKVDLLLEPLVGSS